MKKEYNITGLDCGHCALTLEKYLQRIKGVKNATINFSTSKLFVEIDDYNSRNIIKEIFKTTKQVNPDVKILNNNETDNNASVISIILYVIGIISGVVVLCASINEYIKLVLLIVSILLIGYKTFIKAVLQLIHFRINENTLITISIVGAMLLGEQMESLMVIALYTLGKMLESKAVNYSRKSISALITSQPEYAIMLIDGKEKKVKPEVVKINDCIIVRAGEKIPLDGIVVEGNADVDKKHLTGELLPIKISAGDNIESGCVVLDSTIKIRVTSEYKDSTIAKIFNLVENATNRKSKTESFISKFSSWYTLGVVLLSVLTFGVAWLVLKDWSEALYRGLIFLVVSCPCAFAISVPLSYFSGIGRCSKEGILIKGSSFLDRCADLDKLILDKTGTLTTGQFVVNKIKAYNGFDEDSLLNVVVAGEQQSLHPIAKAICNYYGKLSTLKAEGFKEISGKGIEFYIDRNKYIVGKTQTSSGMTAVDISKDGKGIGRIYLQDEVKNNAKETIVTLNKLNIKSMMLTGDTGIVAKMVSKEISIDEYRSELMPEDKYKIIEELKSKGEKVAFVGDGINDAPALALSDIGISMGVIGSPATIDASDVVIADDNISKIPTLIKISKRTKKIVLQNIIFAGLTKLTFLILGAFGITGMLLAVFADVGVTLLAILNSLRVLTYKNK